MKTSTILGGALALLVLAWSGPAEAGPWTKNWGELYVKLGENFFISDSYRDASGAVISGTNYSGYTTALYFEVGLPVGFQVYSYLPYTVAQNAFDGGNRYLKASGGDAQMGLQYSPHFLDLPFPIAARLEFKVPFYEVAQVSPSFPAPGDGQLDVTVWLSGGGSLGNIPFYFFAEVGYRHRTEHFVGDDTGLSYEDGISMFAQVGYTFFERVLLAVNFGGIMTYTDDTVTKSYLTVGPALYIPVYKGLALEAGFDPIVYSKNSAAGFGFSVGVSYKR
jgi:hypothetical protein